MVEAALRAKGLGTLATEVGWGQLSSVVRVSIDSSAAKSFVSRRGLGRMRHLEVKDLWLQQEVIRGEVVVQKVRGTETPADLMTKILSREDICSRLGGLCLRVGDKENTAKF